jgi:hypothetical protein
MMYATEFILGDVDGAKSGFEPTTRCRHLP